jgi:O-6-methylguanine DNA methyltransferase
MPTASSALILATAIPGPRGPIHLAASVRGIVAIDLLTPPDEFLADLARRFGATPRFVEPAEADGHLRDGVDAVRRFLAGDASGMTDLALDLGDRPAWDRAVLAAVRAVPWGETSSYGGIASAIGHRGAARAVGGAVGRNPISLAVPCHRIIAGDGSLGGYGGGWWGSRELRLDLKRELLEREGTTIGNGAGGGARHQHDGDSRIVAQATSEAFPPR